MRLGDRARVRLADPVNHPQEWNDAAGMSVDVIRKIQVDIAVENGPEESR